LSRDFWTDDRLFELLHDFEQRESGLFVVSSTYVAARVTRLGEFSPNERLFTLGSFLENTEVLVGYISRNNVIFLTKICIKL
jgi:hypothetical protein